MNKPPGPATSLRVSLTRRLALVLAGIGLLGTVVAYVLGSSYANKAYDRALFDDVETLAEQISVEGGEIHVNLPVAALKWLLADEGEVVRYRVTDLRNMQIVASNGDLGPYPGTGQGYPQPGFRDQQLAALSLRIAYLRQHIGPTAIPLLVEIGETTRKRQQMTQAILVTIALLMTTIIAAAAGLVWQGVGSALAPLQLLEAEAAQRSVNDLQPLDLSHAPEEVHGLVNAFNRLMARVATVMESQSHFIANAAHQLRTPLAGLRLQAQLASKATAPEAMRASLLEVEASAARASHLIEQLLVLSKAEAVDPASEGLPIDVAVVIREVVERYLPLADQRQMDLGYEGDAGAVLVAGSDMLFAELLGNLVDNALRYGHDGGRVTLEAYRIGPEVLIAVSDDGPGFPEAGRDQLFQRFFRSDSAVRGGAGLGLAIVREIAERYDGRLALYSQPGQGSRFELWFPGAEA